LETFTKSQTFSPDWPKVGLIGVEKGTNMGKEWFSRVGRNIT